MITCVHVCDYMCHVIIQYYDMSMHLCVIAACCPGDGLLHAEGEEGETGNSFEVGSRELLERFTPSDPNMTDGGQGMLKYCA